MSFMKTKLQIKFNCFWQNFKFSLKLTENRLNILIGVQQLLLFWPPQKCCSCIRVQNKSDINYH